MRLTLRTLLAYLDNTLEPQDAEILRLKVEQSGFATQLVQRIRSSVSDGSLSAPSPDSVHPIEEPNMMSNYLDSTLSPEQIAEIEKACLESLPHLAEAAACHQILTMVLGRPAEVSDRLRGRVLAMVDAKGNVVEREFRRSSGGYLGDDRSAVIAGEIGPRFSDIHLAAESPDADDNAGEDSNDSAIEDQLFEHAASLQPVLHPNDQAPREVKPVGVDDSGVFQAATKLRTQSHQFAEAGTALDDSGILAGERPQRPLEPADLYSGEVRSSRVTPWIISLALVATLLFAISQIFAPLFGPRIAKNDLESSDRTSIEESEPITGDSVEPKDATDPDPNLETSDSNSKSNSSSDRDSGADMEMLPAPEPEPMPERVDPQDDQDGSNNPDRTPPPMVPDPSIRDTVPSDGNAAQTDTSPEVPAPRMPAPLVPADASDEVVMEDSDGPPIPIEMSNSQPLEKIAALPNVDSVETIDPGIVVARLISDQALVAALQADGQWGLLAPDATVAAGQTIVCGPEYRATFAMPATETASNTLVGPAEIRWQSGTDTTNLVVRYGRGIVKLGGPGSAGIQVAGVDLVARSGSPDSMIGYDVSYHRDLGLDPMVPENRKTILALTSINGDFSISGFGETIELGAGSQVQIDLGRPETEPIEVTKPANLPSWIDPEVDTGSLEAEAAAGLLELVRSDGSGSLMLSLRVSLGFRRNEVAALAGKTMLALGDASAYFGVDGIFADARQRLYWSSHLDSVRELINRSAREAALVRTAIAGPDAAMDNADGDTLYRILNGYSQDQLAAGGDAELVAGLESGSLPVRVLASEHLRDISGTTLFYKPDEEVVSRREEVVKKWKVRLRKESIRYSAAE